MPPHNLFSNNLFSNKPFSNNPLSDMPDAVSRLRDVTVALFLLLLGAPVLLGAALAVKFSSSGPVFYRQERVGRDGRLFQIWKFRTMRSGGQNESAGQNGPFVTAQDDSRVTPLGRYLRSWKLDELPQLFNVLRGDMSLVGPRPQVPRFVNCFDAGLCRIALSVRPGMTGPAALYFRHEEFLLTGRSDREGFYIRQILPIKLQMDAEYVRRRSPAYDLQILVDTLRLVLSRLIGRAGSSGIPTASELSALQSAAQAAELAQQTAELVQMANMARDAELAHTA
jgi:lipopolysaccharide/colanic/teichoic acid biosynthesis glycosyltransferase